MPKPPNSNQREVLAWLIERPTEPPPSESWKLSAASLKARGLVTVSRKTGTYVAAPTEAGRYFHEHGKYPKLGPAAAQALRQNQAVPQRQETSETNKAVSSSSPKPTEPAAPPQRISNPHPAVRSLRDHPVALPSNPLDRRRALLAAHALVRAAEAQGFGIEGHTQPSRSTRADRTFYSGEPFITLKTEHVELEVSIGEQMARVPHEKTAEERRKIDKGQYVWVPQYDWHPTGKTFFKVGKGYGSKKYLETEHKALEEYVPKVIARVLAESERSRVLIEQQQAREAEARRRAEAARLLRERREHYERWEASLLDQQVIWEEAKRLREYLAALRSGPAAQEAPLFLDWAQGYVEMLDPTVNVQVPEGTQPDLSHEERSRLGRLPANEPKKVWPYI